MQIDWYFQLLNPLVFIIFAGGFVCVHRMRSSLAALLFAASYMVGALSFIADIVVHESTSVLIRTGVAALYAGTVVLLVCGMWQHYRGFAPWRMLLGLLAVHLILYACLMGLNADWARSIFVNFGCGLLLSVGLFAFRGPSMPDRFLFFIHSASCVVCFTRPIAVALLHEGPAFAAAHDEDLLLLSLHLVAAASAVTTGMVLLAILSRAIFEDLQISSVTDPLTGLLNRRGFEARAHHIVNNDGDAAFTVIMADIDFFKRVNDTFGHSVGDAVIAAVGRLMQGYGASQGVVARFGGEEFVLLLQERDLPDGCVLAEDLRCSVEQLNFGELSPLLSITASFGIARRQQGEHLNSLISRADEALYLAKSSGRNCVRSETDLALRDMKGLTAGTVEDHEIEKTAPIETAS